MTAQATTKTAEDVWVESFGNSTEVRKARSKLIANFPPADFPFAVYIDGGIVGCRKTREHCTIDAKWYKTVFPGKRRVVIRQRKGDPARERVWGEDRWPC